MEDKYVCVAKVPDVNEARVIAARLETEGVNTRLHGEPMGPFPMTIGRLAETELWVKAEHRPTAAIVLDDLGPRRSEDDYSLEGCRNESRYSECGEDWCGSGAGEIAHWCGICQ